MKFVILSLLKKGEKSLFEIFRYAQYDKFQHFLVKNSKNNRKFKHFKIKFKAKKGKTMPRMEEIAAKALLAMKNDRYKLALAVAKRAEDLAGGAVPLVEANVEQTKLSDIAIMEIAEGKLVLEDSIEGS